MDAKTVKEIMKSKIYYTLDQFTERGNDGLGREIRYIKHENYRRFVEDLLVILPLKSDFTKPCDCVTSAQLKVCKDVDTCSGFYGSTPEQKKKKTILLRNRFILRLIMFVTFLAVTTMFINCKRENNRLKEEVERLKMRKLVKPFL